MSRKNAIPGSKCGVPIHMLYIEQSDTHVIIGDLIAGHHILISVYHNKKTYQNKLLGYF